MALSSLLVHIDGDTYDLTKFASIHPGGQSILKGFAGKDASAEFHALHNREVLQKYAHLKVTTQTHERPRAEVKEKPIPYADLPVWEGRASPHYKASHRAFKEKIRAFVDKEIIPYVDQWERQGDYPSSLREKARDAGILGAIYPEEYGGCRPADFDTFHDLIYNDEMARAGAGGVMAGLLGGMTIGLPPIMMVGSEEMKRTVVPEVVSGRKQICLAITEPYGGSDVAELQCTAAKTADGRHFIVNGEKKFITGGMKADYFVTVCRTGGKGISGISLLLLSGDMHGITRRRIPTQGWRSSNTAYLAFDNVRVPVENLIGQEGQGFLPIMLQFNHERFTMMIGSNRAARICVEDSVEFARHRRTFGKKLIEHQVIRHKLAEMCRHIEATHAFIEAVAVQMEMGANPRHIASLTALGKVQATKTMEFCAREASQILGGASYVQGQGKGRRIERLYREVRVQAIGGGSEEIMLDLFGRAAKL